jgi:hypothetical protein
VPFLEDKQRFCGHPDDQQESRRTHCEHYERPEMMFLCRRKERFSSMPTSLPSLAVDSQTIAHLPVTG